MTLQATMLSQPISTKIKNLSSLEIKQEVIEPEKRHWMLQWWMAAIAL
jgi:hypothetical protein